MISEASHPRIPIERPIETENFLYAVVHHHRHMPHFPCRQSFTPHHYVFGLKHGLLINGEDFIDDPHQHGNSRLNGIPALNGSEAVQDFFEDCHIRD